MQPSLSNSKELDLKVLVCQIDPEYKSPKKNIDRVRVSLEKYSDKDQIDVILFPEMAFTGYKFTDPKDVLPFCEEAGRGETFTFAVELAKKTKAYVMIGYPEREVTLFSGPSLYNSMMLVGRKGDLLFNYRKHFLYDDDKTWCNEGPGFQTIELTNTKGEKFKAGLGICMDINPWEFEDSGKFEFANFMLANKVDALFLMCCWTDNEPKSDDGKSIQKLVNYWLERLTPLFTSKKNWAFFAASRVGVESSTTYAGSSCAVKRENENSVKLLSCLNKRKEAYLLAELTIS
jgi:protein N-terminal amidase